jgi:nucleotide-binding universal stress UspA family protein
MPVLLVRPEEGVEVDPNDRRGFGRILVALDGSRQAEESLKWVRAIGGNETAYTLVRVAPKSVPVWAVDPTCVSLDLRDFAKIANIKVTEYLSRVERLLNNGKRKVESVAVEGVAAAVGILNTADQKEADLIAITTHGRGGLPRLVLGSVTDKVVRASRVPVLVVRPRGK